MAGSTTRSADALSSGASREIARTLVRFLRDRFTVGARVCVGLSGGLDSVVLLHALHRRRSSGQPFELSALHVHHGLSPHADAWADFCANFCASLGVRLDIVRVHVPRDGGDGLEAAARRVRHAAFARCAAEWLALAHHRDDQAETVLFRLLRGAGVAGVAGMLPERGQHVTGARLIRPLLDVPRQSIARYADENALAWVTDESNDDSRFRRNFLRNDVMPRLAAEFPGAGRSLARAAGHFAEAATLLDELATLDHAATIDADGRLDVATFNGLSAPRARNLLRYVLRLAGFRAPQTRWIDEARRQLATVKVDSELCLGIDEGELHVYRGRLHILSRRLPVPEGSVPWAGEVVLPWGEGRVLFVPTEGAGVSRLRLARAPVFLASRQGGERLRPDSRRPRRALRKLLQAAAVPPWERRGLPLLWCGGDLVWVGGVGVDTAFACLPGEEGLAVYWQSGGRQSSVEDS